MEENNVVVLFSSSESRPLHIEVRWEIMPAFESQNIQNIVCQKISESLYVFL